MSSACGVATSAFCEKRSALRRAEDGRRENARKSSGTRAHRRFPASAVPPSTGLNTWRPSSIARENEDAPAPIGATTPTPVTATALIWASVGHFDLAQAGTIAHEQSADTPDPRERAALLRATTGAKHAATEGGRSPRTLMNS